MFGVCLIWPTSWRGKGLVLCPVSTSSTTTSCLACGACGEPYLVASFLASMQSSYVMAEQGPEFIHDALPLRLAWVSTRSNTGERCPPPRHDPAVNDYCCLLFCVERSARRPAHGKRRPPPHRRSAPSRRNVYKQTRSWPRPSPVLVLVTRPVEPQAGKTPHL